MKERIIVLLILILVGTSGFVYALSLPSEIYYRVNVQEGWNLVYGFYDPAEQFNFVDLAIYEKERLGTSDLSVIYGFNPKTKQYGQVYPTYESEKLSDLDKSQLINSAFWVYAKRTGYIKYRVLFQDKIYFSQRSLYAGWNFVGLTEEMIENSDQPDISLDDIKGTCQIKKAYLFENGNWKVFDYPEMDSTLLGKGLVIKVKDNCKLGKTGITPPPLPDPNGLLTFQQCQNLGGLAFTDPGDGSLRNCPDGMGKIGGISGTYEGGLCCKVLDF